MFRVLAVLLFVALIVLGIAIWRDWLTFSVNRPDDGPTNINIAVHDEKFKDDVARLHKSVKDSAPRELKGKIADVDPDKKTVVVQDTQERITLKVTDATTIQIGDKSGTFADLQAGARVTASYVPQEGTPTARSLRVDAPARGDAEP